MWEAKKNGQKKKQKEGVEGKRGDNFEKETNYKETKTVTHRTRKNGSLRTEVTIYIFRIEKYLSQLILWLFF